MVRVKASPKHPQSFTGSAMYIHTVISVITAIKASVSLDVNWRFMANSKNTPRANSMAARATAAERVVHCGTIAARSIAAR